MTKALHRYELLAELLLYPGPTTAAVALACRDSLAPRSARAAALVEEFHGGVASLPTASLEELYTRTFDLRPDRCMDLGHQLFGDGGRRGAFLVRMQHAVHVHHVAHPTELADHLPVVLNLLPHLAEDDSPAELVADVVVPSVNKLLGTFDAHEENPYRALLSAVVAILAHDYAVAEARDPMLQGVPVDLADARRRGDVLTGS